MSSGKGHVTVIGAGIVGICCALQLQREGLGVTVFDPGGPGEGASAGNAGLIANGSCAPLAMPGIARQVPGMLLDPLGPLTIRWSYLPRMAPWLARFLAAASPRRADLISQGLFALNQQAVDDLRVLVEEAGAGELLKLDGRIDLYGGAEALANSSFKRELLQRRGVPFELLNGEEIARAEPALGHPCHGGLLYSDHAHVIDPLRLTQRLAGHFRKKGGEIIQERVRGFELGEGEARRLFTDEGSRPVDLLLLAAGAESGQLSARLGYRVPLEAERGYNMDLPDPGIELRRPLLSGDHHFAITPMSLGGRPGGLRLAGTAEFAGLNAPPNYARSDRLLKAARTIFPNLNARGATSWMGSRPSMPDSLPVIAKSPRDGKVFFAFGHGHLGLTGAGSTAKLIADLVAGRKPWIDPTPYRIERF